MKKIMMNLVNNRTTARWKGSVAKINKGMAGLGEEARARGLNSKRLQQQLHIAGQGLGARQPPGA